jgi:hypothetical protein
MLPWWYYGSLQAQLSFPSANTLSHPWQPKASYRYSNQSLVNPMVKVHEMMKMIICLLEAGCRKKNCVASNVKHEELLSCQKTFLSSPCPRCTLHVHPHLLRMPTGPASRSLDLSNRSTSVQIEFKEEVTRLCDHL